MRVDTFDLVTNLKRKALSVSALNDIIYRFFFLQGFSYFDNSHSKGQRTNVKVLQTAKHLRARWVRKPSGSL